MSRRYALTDEQWSKLEPLLPGRKGHVGMTAKDNRLFIDAVLFRYRSGIPWRDLPERFGDFRVVHTRFSRWSQKGVWERVFKILSADADNEYAMIDSTIVRAHQHSSGGGADEAIGRSAGGLSTKINSVVDALGNPTLFFLTAGQASDLEGADALIPQIKANALLADKAYDADERVRDVLKQKSIEPVIPFRKNRLNPPDYDKALYKARYLIEHFFGKLKQYRAIATRYDKRARNFLSGVYLASTLILLA
ncbi:IS5 family transposase [Beggiatoa leptomitoformis]|uniref:IS5 family transposase n=1 Tax=Beggiatoa leptomitoformis TaxID=288004 RepID=UPI00191ECBCB|nr:IS5 family transposase [Beggiatoa leptomitoformis]